MIEKTAEVWVTGMMTTIYNQGFRSISEELTEMSNDGYLENEKKGKKERKERNINCMFSGSHGGAPPSWSARLPAGR